MGANRIFRVNDLVSTCLRLKRADPTVSYSIRIQVGDNSVSVDCAGVCAYEGED